MKNFVFSRIRKTYDSILERLPFHKTQQQQQRSFTPSEKTSSNVCASILSSCESYIASIQSLLIWEHPAWTATALILINFVFWIAVSWNRRFISVVAWGILLIYLYRVWVNKIWPEIRVPPNEEDLQCIEEEWTPIHPNILSAPELIDFINESLRQLRNLFLAILSIRKVSHGRFCIITSGLCFLLAYLGHVVPGVLLIYFLVMGLCLAPGIAYYLSPYDFPLGVDDFLTRCSSRLHDPPPRNSDSDLDEFLPETSAAVLRQLSAVSSYPTRELKPLEEKDEEEEEHNSGTNELETTNGTTADSEESSLYAGLGAFPNVEEVNESDVDDEDIVLPEDENAAKENIKFVSTHYKEDSGSDSDAAFTEGLSFEPSSAKVKESSKSGDHIAKEEKTKVVPSASDSDEELDDFEILEESEITESTK